MNAKMESLVLFIIDEAIKNKDFEEIKKQIEMVKKVIAHKMNTIDELKNLSEDGIKELEKEVMPVKSIINMYEEILSLWKDRLEKLEEIHNEK